MNTYKIISGKKHEGAASFHPGLVPSKVRGYYRYLVG
jgi:hypothetical protein